jgi:hypothetical protein
MNLASGNFPLEGELPALTRGSFHATFEVPQRVSSFEKLYEPQQQQHQQDFLSDDATPPPANSSNEPLNEE